MICHDAVEVLTGGDRRIDSFDDLLVFFPDPWHKKRHHKRRLIEPHFIAPLADKLRPGGVLRLATDWQEYAEQMLQRLQRLRSLASLSADGGYVRGPSSGRRPDSNGAARASATASGIWLSSDRALSRHPARSAVSG